MPGPHPDVPKPDCLPCPTCGYDLSTVPRASACPECGTAKAPSDATAPGSPRSELELERHATTVLGLNIFAIGLALMAAAIAINLGLGPWVQALNTTTNQNGVPNPAPLLSTHLVFRSSTALVGIPALVALGGVWVLSTRRVLGSAPGLRWWLRALLLATGTAVATLAAHRAIAASIPSTIAQTPTILRTVNWRDGACYTLALLSPFLIGLMIAAFGVVAEHLRAADLAARCRRWRVAVTVILLLLISCTVALDFAYAFDFARKTAQLEISAVRAIPLDSYFPDWATPEVLAWWRMLTYAAIAATLLATFITALQLTALINVRRRLPHA